MLNEFQKTRTNRTFNCLPANKHNQLVSVDLKEAFDKDIILVTEHGYVLKYDLEEVSTQSLNAKGVKGINLRDDLLVGAKYATTINKDEVIMLTNRGGLKREFVSNIEYSHRPAKGKRYLKTVQSNPYRFVSMTTENIFRLKEFITVRLLAKKKDLTIPGVDLKPDRYENGIPYLDKSDQPFKMMIEINNYHENKFILIDLIDVIEPVEVEETDEVMNELEKIISSASEKEETTSYFEEKVEDNFEEETEKDDEEDDDFEDIIQQTLF
jgi:hypothetical protein